MTQCIVYDETTKESQTFYALIAAKKWMKERIKQGHEVRGQKYKVYSDGDFVNCGTISLTVIINHLLQIRDKPKKDIRRHYEKTIIYSL